MDPILYVGDSFDIKQVLNESGKKIDAVQNGMIALNALSDSENKYSAVIIEDQLPLMDPSNLIKQLEHYSKTPIIAIVRSDKRRSEILTDFENGLSGWFEPKGSSIEHFNDLLDSCYTFINFSRALNKNQRLQVNSHGLGTILGVSDSMQKIYTLLLQIQEKDVITILYGESGTGKNLTAKFMHDTSKRSKKPLISVNCPAIPSELLESELFGHEKGAFTGADKQRKGRFEQSSGGSLFLDEIGDMPLPLQAKLLRAIESKTIQRVGGAQDIKIDLRLICATHRDLEKKVENGEFRADLFFRINVLPINVPSLAERRTDIPSLQKTLLNNLKVDEVQKPIFTPDAITALCKHNWPGNVRELKNVIERACIIFPGKEITSTNIYENLLRLKVPTVAEEQEALWDMTSDLSGITNLEEQNTTHNLEDYLPHPKNYKNWFSFYDEIDLRRHLQDVEIVLIEEALEKTNNKVALAADKLKLRRTTLIEKMKKYSLTSI